MAVTFLGKGAWWLDYWNPSECTIVKCTDGKYGVLDHSVQTLVATGDTEKECGEWLHGAPEPIDPDITFEEIA